MPVRRQVVRPVALAVSGLLLFGLGVTAGSQAPDEPPATPVDQALTLIGDRAVSDPSPGSLEDAAISGALEALGDPWASFYPASEADETAAALPGSYSGTGLWLRRADASDAAPLRVTSVLAGSAADLAGARVDDVLVSVDGVAVAGRGLAEVVAGLRGPAGSTVTVEVQRADGTQGLALVRTEVRAGDVTSSQLTPGVLQVGVAHFSRGVSQQVADALTGAPGASVLLDLRGNPGGLLDEAVRTASLFLDGGPVVQYSERGAGVRQIAASPGGDLERPLVVLVDGASASAAEVLAGALQDRGRAVLVGSRTFGKGSVQQPVTLTDGSSLTLTVGHYRTPAGRDLDGTGLEPDVQVAPGTGPQAAVDRAVTILSGLLADSGAGG